MKGGDGTAKTLDEINREYQDALTRRKESRQTVYANHNTPPDAPNKRSMPRDTRANAKRRWIQPLSDVLYYLGLGIVILIMMTHSAKTGAPKMLLGYTCFTVLTSSMQSEIPRGSLILVKQADPKSIQAGDDITYMRDESTSITHKVIQVIENFQGSGKRGFQTKGVNNPAPDDAIVYEGNVVGVVILHVPILGAALSFIRENLFMVFVVLGLMVLLSFALRLLFAPSDSERGRRKTSGWRERALKKRWERNTGRARHAPEHVKGRAIYDLSSATLFFQGGHE